MQIAVRDEGIGIEPRDLDRIFERFYRADRARSRSTGGTGLGLAIVKHIATNHGGRVEVTSTVGEGSTFTLRLPARSPELGGSQPDSVGIHSIGSRRGDRRWRGCLSWRTRSRSPTPCRTCCARRASRSPSRRPARRRSREFDRTGADIVLLDLMLPEMSGTEVCRQLRQKSPVPIIMVTARDSEIDKVVGLEIGADDYVTKPYSPRELVARIRAVLRRNAKDAAAEPAPPTLSAGPVRMDVDRHVVTVSGAAVQLPLKEFELLELLLRNAGRVLTRGQLIDRVWGADYVGDTKTLDVHIKRLRSKIEPEPPTPRHIVTVRGLGLQVRAVARPSRPFWAVRLIAARFVGSGEGTVRVFMTERHADAMGMAWTSTSTSTGPQPTPSRPSWPRVAR